MIGTMVESFVTSSVLILVILLLRKLCRGKIKSSLQYSIWLIVAVKLLLVPVPFWESSFSIMNLVEKDREERMGAVPGTDSNTETTYILGDEILGNAVVLEDEAVESMYIPEETQISVVQGNKSGWKSFLDAVPYVFYTNALLLAMWMIVINIRFYGKLRKSRMSYENESYGGNGRNPRIYLIEKLDTPCLYGTGIYLPLEMAQDEKKMRHILAHETSHYRQGDFIWSFFRLLCLVLNWYNPFVWIAAAAVKQDCELACDEAAIKVLGEEERISYGETLIQLIGEKRPQDILAVSTQMTGDKKEMKTRISLIAKKPVTVVSIVIVMTVVLTAAVFCTFTGKEEEKTEENPEQDIRTETAGKDVPNEGIGEKFSDEVVFEPEDGDTMAGEGQEQEESLAEAEIPRKFTKEELADEFAQLTEDSTFSVFVRSIARSAREIDRFSLPAEVWRHTEEPSLYGGLAFSDDCIFCFYHFNAELGIMELKETDFDSFVDGISWDDAADVECKVTCKDGLVTYMVAYNTYSGITYSEPEEKRDYYDLHGTEGYKLAGTYMADVSEAEGMEKIYVYSGNMGDGDGGYVVIEKWRSGTDQLKEVLWIEEAHTARDGWNNVYLGEINGKAYLFTLTIDIRDGYGTLAYHAFRLGEDGNPLPYNGAEYTYDMETYNAENFTQWYSSMSAYMNQSFLLLSTQDGVLKTGSGTVYGYQQTGSNPSDNGSTVIPAPEQTDYELIELERMIEGGFF